MMEKRRWNCVDALRVLALFLIILYHYETNLGTSNLISLEDMGIRYENANFHMAKIGVELFFMISGFGLMCGNYEISSWKKFFKKRFLRIYIPFYLVTIAAYLAKRIMTGGPVFSSDIPKWHIIFTILGIDGYLGEYGIATYSMGIGEWFVGCMIFMYLSFPFLWKAMKRNRNVTMLVATLCYIVITACYAGEIPAHYFFGIKIYAFILGMYFALVLKKPERKYAVFAGTAALILLVLPWKIPMNDDYVLSVFCGLLFLFAFHMEDVRAARNMASGTFIKKLAACSYEMFLIHHWGLILMTKVLKPQVMWKIVAAFILEFIVIYLGATILRMLVKWIEKQLECLEYRCIGRKI